MAFKAVLSAVEGQVDVRVEVAYLFLAKRPHHPLKREIDLSKLLLTVVSLNTFGSTE